MSFISHRRQLIPSFPVSEEFFSRASEVSPEKCKKCCCYCHRRRSFFALILSIYRQLEVGIMREKVEKHLDMYTYTYMHVQHFASSFMCMKEIECDTDVTDRSIVVHSLRTHEKGEQ